MVLGLLLQPRGLSENVVLAVVVFFNSVSFVFFVFFKTYLKV